MAPEFRPIWEACDVEQQELKQLEARKQEQRLRAQARAERENDAVKRRDALPQFCEIISIDCFILLIIK